MCDDIDTSVDTADYDSSDIDTSDVDTSDTSYDDSDYEDFDDSSYDDVSDEIEDVPEDSENFEYEETDYSDDSEEIPEDIEDNDYESETDEELEDIPEDVGEPDDIDEESFSETEEIDEDIEDSYEEDTDEEDVVEDIPEDVDNTSDDGIDDTADEAVEDTSEDDIEDSADEAVDDTTEDGVEDSADEAIEDTSEDDIEDSADEAVNDTTEDNVEDTVDDTTDDDVENTVNEMVDDTAENGVGDTADETVDDTTENGVEYTANEAIDDTTDDGGKDAANEADNDTIDDVIEDAFDEDIDNTTESKSKDITNAESLSSDDKDDIPQDVQGKTPQQRLADYMSDHNYGRDDFDTYSQDAEWRELQRKAYPNYEMPPLSQECASKQLYDYMAEHNYGQDDFDIYSQNSLWRELQSAAYPEYELPPLKEQILSDLKNECVKNEYAEYADFSDFDPKVAEATVNALKDAKSDFPDLKLGYIGSIENQVSGIKAIAKQAYKKQLSDMYGNSIPESVCDEMAQKQADNYITKYGLDDTECTFAWSLEIPKEIDPSGNGMSKFKGVGINGKYASSNEDFTAAKIEEVSSKHKPIGCDTPRATADHELGHEIDKLLNASSDSVITSLYNKMMIDGDAKEQLSGYSQTNIKEFIAEAYSEYRNNPHPRDYSTKVYNRLIELRDNRTRRYL